MVKIAASIRRTVCAVSKLAIHLAMIGPNTGHTRNIATRSDDTCRVLSQLVFSLLASKVFHDMRADQGLLRSLFLGIGISGQIVDELQSTRHDVETWSLQYIRRRRSFHTGQIDSPSSALQHTNSPEPTCWTPNLSRTAVSCSCDYHAVHE